ncbi:hypothetical protein UA08_08261 [Talaromyces atroroseus]|uniref:ATP-dependent bile acid permease n=1 Tax=Talaromyces atroroseus TaxID=1441469 RepID=A0A225ANK1_TALAT|nr:hypothetical protein UA08_08261 [Talaromyces atroroseus]OKL56526.1 hypothetical protein UA08_08261 [Talaromyces atroroseus]
MLFSLNQTPLAQEPDTYNAKALAAGIAVLALGLFLSVPSVTAIAFHYRQPKPKPSLYEDKDGVASEESMAAYSAKTPKIILSVFTMVGFAAATFLAVVTTLHRNDYAIFVQNWLNVAQWALVLVQVVSINIVREPTKSYSLGLYSALSCACLFMLLLFQVGILVQSQSRHHHSWTYSAQIATKSSQLVATIIAALASVSLPRRPDVFYDGAPVDKMFTQSALYKASFSWVQSVLLLARKTGHLDLKDLPKMSHRIRAKDLSKTWAEQERPRRLWIEVILAYKWPLITQWSLTIVQAFGNFAPQFVIFQILRILENRFYGEQVPAEAWIWVIVLTLTTISSSWIEAWLYWVSWSELGIPVRAQLSALIFQKSMRRKDVKAASKVLKVEDGDASRDNAESGEEEEDDNPKGKQSTVNLIGVDTKRVSDFCSFNNYFPGSISKLLVSLAFLWSILGWQSLLAGFLAMAVTIPINIFFSKRYSDAQDRVMKARDLKMAVVTEALQGIRQIKFSALEANWYHKIGQFRAKELEEQWSVFVADTFLLFCWISSPILLSAASLAVYALLNGTLTPSVAFTAIGVFGNLEVTLSVIPELTADLIDAYISIGRIEKYLNSPEITAITSDVSSISFENASIAWPSDESSDTAGDRRYILRNLDLSFPKNELSVVSGKTGTGKSLLLAAILGEVDILSGKIKVPHAPSTQERHDHLATKDNWIIPSSIAFVAQIPWIENASIKDNILFGLPFDEQRYNKVIESCALRKDLDMLSDGEDTEIGANGINLSGGQRWRVTFARALYSRAGTLILDDIFSAVDAHVGRFIFEKGLTGELGVGRTRILVTHHVALVKSRTKYVVELGDGTVENAGLVNDLEEAGTLDNIVSHQESESEIQEDEEAPTAVNSEESSDTETMDQLKKVNSKQSPKKFVEEEARERGRVKIKIFLAYMKAAGGFKFWAMALLAFATLQCVSLCRSWWLKVWTGNGDEESMAHTVGYSFHSQTLTPFYTTSSNLSVLSDNAKPDYSLGFYLSIYVALSVIGASVGTFKYYYIYTGAIRASRVLFNDLCYTVLRTPLRWVDTVPLGRILNRFTSDFEVIDARLSGDISGGLHDFLQLCGIIAAGIFVSPYVILLSVILLAICIWIASIYLDGAREVKRLESTVKSPIFEQFGSALTGVGTIRAFSKTDTYITRMYGKLDDYSTAFWHLWAFNRWMGLRMALVGGLFSTIVASIILVVPYIEASLAGFALSFALNYGLDVIWIIRHYANLELEMNAVERVTEYSNVKTESQDGADPPAAWPSEGHLEVNNLVVAYAPDLPPVLKGLTFSVERSERIGVVGRTGAGKSSLTLALFRFLEASQGSIHIDGLDISKIKLHALRSRLAIIPQDPVLFSGTVRTNLDAFDEHTDSELRDALERVHLVTASEFASSPGEPSSSANDGAQPDNQNINPFASLSSPVSEGGLNLSQGQRQLLCLARAIVSRPKIVVLDEATSAVDMATDALIQRSIREEFGDSTLIVIAHRLSTIIDFDKILVMNDGRVAEFGTPKELIQIEGGILKSMVQESGEKEKLEKMVLG